MSRKLRNILTLASQAEQAFKQGAVRVSSANLSASRKEVTEKVDQKSASLPLVENPKLFAFPHASISQEVKIIKFDLPKFDIAPFQLKKPVFDKEQTFEMLDEAFYEPLVSQPRVQARGSSSTGRFSGVRHFSTYSSGEKELTVEDVCPWYKEMENPEKDPAIDEFNSFASTLKWRVTSLMNDGFHRSSRITEGGLSGRSRVIANYHRAYLEAEKDVLFDEESELKPNRVSFDGKVEIMCLDSMDEKAQGTSVIAMMNGNVVGRMFMADSHGEYHLTFLSPNNTNLLEEQGVDSMDLGAEMLRSFFNNRNLSEEEFTKLIDSRVRISCVADYRGLLIGIAVRENTLDTNPMFEFTALDEDDAEQGFEEDAEHANVKSNISMLDLARLFGADKYVAPELPAPVVKLTGDEERLFSPSRNQTTV
jgi:hypothetical protein